MSFRTGGFKKSNKVYSRRRGRGGTSLNIAHKQPSIIYEESESESDHEEEQVLKINLLDENSQMDNFAPIRAALKDKSNITVSPMGQYKFHNKSAYELPQSRNRQKARAQAIRTPEEQRYSIQWNEGTNLTTLPCNEKFHSSWTVGPERRPDTGVHSADLAKVVSGKNDNVCSEKFGHFAKSIRASNIKNHFDTKPPKLSRKSHAKDNLSHPSHEGTTFQSLTADSNTEERITKTGILDMKNAVRPDWDISHKKTIVNELRSPTNAMSKRPNVSPVQADTYVDATKIVAHGTDPRAPIVVITSSPPLSSPDIPTDECLQVNDIPVETSSSSVHVIKDHLTPSRGVSQDIQSPPAVRKPFGFWKSPSREVEPFYIASPCPATSMNYEDFVMQRRKRDTPIEEGLLEHHSSDIKAGAGNEKAKLANIALKEDNSNSEDKGRKRVGNKWIRFLDVGISCPSDESDDELAFCKPSQTKETSKHHDV